MAFSYLDPCVPLTLTFACKISTRSSSLCLSQKQGAVRSAEEAQDSPRSDYSSAWETSESDVEGALDLGEFQDTRPSPTTIFEDNHAKMNEKGAKGKFQSFPIAVSDKMELRLIKRSRARHRDQKVCIMITASCEKPRLAADRCLIGPTTVAFRSMVD